MTDLFDNVPPIAAAEHLSTPELASLICSSKHLKVLFQSSLDAPKGEYLVCVRILLCSVVRGEHKRVRELLTNNIHLLYGRSSVFDCSEREFESISPFEYALWALDKPMWDTMLSCIPKNEKGNEVLAQLRAQYKAFKIDETAPEEKVNTAPIKGVTYRLNGQSTTEFHFNFEQTIITQLQIQVDSRDAPGSKNWPAIGKQWVEGVGGAQRLLPRHVVHNYCAMEGFTPTSNFDKNPENYLMFFRNHETSTTLGYWFPAKMVGITGAICNAFKQVAVAVSAETVAQYGAEIRVNLAAMRALYKRRREDFIALEKQLGHSMAADNLPLNNTKAIAGLTIGVGLFAMAAKYFMSSNYKNPVSHKP